MSSLHSAPVSSKRKPTKKPQQQYQKNTNNPTHRMQEEQGGYFLKCFLIKTKKRSTHQSLTGLVKLLVTRTLNWHEEGCVSAYLRSSGTDNGTPGRVLCLLGYCCFVLSISHVMMGNFILQPRLFFQQTEVPQTGEETISINLHFPSTSGEDSPLFFLPPPSRLQTQVIWRLIFGNSHTGRTRFCFCWSQSMSFPRPNCSCTRAHDQEPIVL